MITVLPLSLIIAELLFPDSVVLKRVNTDSSTGLNIVAASLRYVLPYYKVKGCKYNGYSIMLNNENESL